MATHPPEVGEHGFVSGLRRYGCEPEKRHGAIVFSVSPVEGAYAGETVQTGVSCDELTAWPSVPPHWVHLPASVAFRRTNTQPSAVPGWVKHSRNITRWGNAADPAQAWLAHIRSVLEDAQ